jgi:hypothetical protein
MTTNLAHLDRAIRVGSGLFLLATPILNLKTYPYNLFGIVLIATALVGFCPLYSAARAIFPRHRPLGTSQRRELGGPRPTHGFGQLGGRPAR